MLIHLSHWEPRRSISVLLKEVGRWWIHNLTHSCPSSSEWNRRPRMSSFRSPKMWKSQGERSGFYGGCWNFWQPNLWSLSLARGTGVIMQKDDSVRQNSREFWLYRVFHHPQPPRNEPHLSAILCLPPFSMLDQHTLHYAHLQSNKETTVWTCAFSLLHVSYPTYYRIDM